jgi:hypothetical protein
MADMLKIAGISAEQVYQTVRDAGVADSDAKLLVSNWIYQNYLSLARRFDYVTAFPAAVPDCVPPPFVRSFAHRDWFDGEDLVQAGESADDDGMNKRFHKIEGDLDTLGSQIARLASCMAEMRSNLRMLLDEVAAELNRIDGDIGAMRGSTVIGPPHVKSPLGPLLGGGILTNPNISIGPMISNAPGVTGGDPMVGFLGTTMFQERAVSLFNTSQGIVMMPAVDASSPTNLDRRVSSVGALSRAMQENAQLKEATAGAVNRKELVGRFGALTLSNGQTLEQAVAALPQSAQYASGTAMLSDLAQRVAGALQSTTGLPQQLAVTVNASRDATSLAAVDISGLKDFPPDATAILRRAGITTIGQVAATTSEKLASVLREGNVAISVGEIATVQGTAQTLSNVQIR